MLDGPIMDQDDDFVMPIEDDFVPVMARPICVICGKELIHAEVRGVSKPKDYLHVWICDCEPQPEEVMVLIQSIRELSETKGDSIVIFIEDDEEEKNDNNNNSSRGSTMGFSEWEISRLW